MRIYTKSHRENCIAFYREVKPSDEKLDDFILRRICKIDDVIYISDELNIL